MPGTDDADALGLTEEDEGQEIRPQEEKPRLIEWVLFLPFLAAFLGVLCFFEVAQRIARPFGIKALERAVRFLNFGVYTSLRVLLTRFSVKGDPNVPADKPYIIVSNHQSMFDISFIHHTFHSLRPRFIAKKELARGIPGVSYCLRTEGSAIIDRSSKSQAIREIIKLAKRMKEGNFSVVLFPEGTRARDGKLKRFRPAGFAVLRKSLPEAGIIPIAIDGSWRYSTRKYGPPPAGVKLSLSVAPPVVTAGKSDEVLLEELHSTIERMLEEIRSEQ